MSNPEPPTRPSADAVRYTIDADDRIVDVGGGWSEFAGANDGHSLLSGIVGTSLWDHISGVSVRHIYRGLLSRARLGRRIRIPCRCDGPDVKRDIELTLDGLPGGHVRFSGQVLAERKRHTVMLPPSSLLRACSWCARVWIEEAWLELEDAVERLDALGWKGGASPGFTHGICEDCQRAIETDI